RLQGDWSSDVCSSDLKQAEDLLPEKRGESVCLLRHSTARRARGCVPRNDNASLSSLREYWRLDTPPLAALAVAFLAMRTFRCSRSEERRVGKERRCTG